MARSTIRPTAPSATVSVTAPELAALLVFAFRYSLERQSAAVPTLADLLRTYGHVLPNWQRSQMVTDIVAAIAGGRAGTPCEERIWRDIQARLERMTGK